MPCRSPERSFHGVKQLRPHHGSATELSQRLRHLPETGEWHDSSDEEFEVVEDGFTYPVTSRPVLKSAFPSSSDRR